MAPFARGRGGRTKGVYRGRGRGRGGFNSRGKKPSTFYSTRVEEQVQRHVHGPLQFVTVSKLC